MDEYIQLFCNLKPEGQKFAGAGRSLHSLLAHTAGGKGIMLANMFQHGYPVPEGFVILPAAFQAETLIPQAWDEIRKQLQVMRKKYKQAAFAVRSSAPGEDSARTSFAGEFETVLNAETDTEIRKAVYTVFRSGASQRVKVYSDLQGITRIQSLAVIIQLMVKADISGVLFTADPVTGSFSHMSGNYVHGTGEQLVGGDADARNFEIKRPRAEYSGPAECRRYALKLYKYALKLEKEQGMAQDVEWAVAKGKLYLLQARPITSLHSGDRDSYAINDSCSGDALWVNTNVAEAIPDVFSPLTWSVLRALDEEQNFIPGYFTWSGNICGRVYSNISRRLSAIATLNGWDIKRAMVLLGNAFGKFPDGIEIPRYPYTRSALIKDIFPGAWRLIRGLLRASKDLPQLLSTTPHWCRRLTEQLKKVKSPAELVLLWNKVIRPYTSRTWWGLLAAGSKAILTVTLNRKLTSLTGAEDAQILLSNMRGQAGLASLGPVAGLSAILNGTLTREKYLQQYGHRGTHEFELSLPHPAEETDWLENQITAFQKSGKDVEELLTKQAARFDAALLRFQRRFPAKIKWLTKKIAKIGAAMRIREAARSEFIRVFRVIRAFALAAGRLTESGEDLFFLYIDEVLTLLSGNTTPLTHIAARKKTYNEYRSLPPYPSIIRGKFDPFQWAQDPHKRYDYYDPALPAAAAEHTGKLTGFAASAGRIEGRVRILPTPEEGESLKPGEILVAATTNIGWTLLFPKAGAIITDVGAPLSHAAIVARELGIPAVLSCGNATTRLKTGDRVLVDGGQGIVYLFTRNLH